MGSETAEQKQSNLNELKEKQITKEPTYIVWEVVIYNILGLFSSSAPSACYLTFCLFLVLTFCGGALFGTLFFDIQFLTLPRWKYSFIVSYIMVRLITSGRESSPTTRNLESTETEPIYHWLTSWSIVRPARYDAFVSGHDRSAMVRDGRAVKARKGAMMNKWRYG